MQKLKIIFYAFIWVIFLSITLTTIYLINTNKKLKTELIQEKYKSDRFELINKKIIEEKNQLRIEANQHKIKADYYEKVMDSIYRTALLDSNEDIIKFFSEGERQYQNKFKYRLP